MGALSFILSPIGRIVGIGAVVLALMGGLYLKGRGDGAAKAEAACAAARAIEIGRQMQASTAAQEADKARAEATEKALAASQALVESLTEDVRRRPPAAVCTVEKSDVGKLRAIR
jgi:hypothetical protein